jgi:hypothetical protein
MISLYVVYIYYIRSESLYFTMFIYIIIYIYTAIASLSKLILTNKVRGRMGTTW